LLRVEKFAVESLTIDFPEPFTLKLKDDTKIKSMIRYNSKTNTITGLIHPLGND
jgi:hypothetical protein